MKKIFALVLGLFIGCGNFAYASTSMDCGNMKQSSTSKSGFSAQETHSCCCQSDACPCSIQTNQNELVASLSQAVRPSVEASSIRLSDGSATIFKTATQSLFLFQKSPPKEAHLYDLYSIYRI